jgi:hypothetical protein
LQDVQDFGVAVSTADAAQIERTGDAIAKLSLIWLGLTNRLTAAVAPALETVANALADMARGTGPIGGAITAVFDNLARLATYAATFAAFMAGRWVAGLAVAALSMRGLATALVFLRGALIRTGIGALIVGAGELVYQFSQLVTRVGGVGEAFRLLGDLAKEVWSRIGLSLDAAFANMAAGWEGLKAAGLSALEGTIAGVVSFGDRTAAIFQGAYDAAVAIWGSLPGAIGDFAFQAANGLISGVEAMLNGVVTRINNFINGLNAALDLLPDWAVGEGGVRIGTLDPVELARIGNPFEGAATAAGAAARDAGADAAAGADQTATGWGAVTAALADYATEARSIGGDIGQALVGAFSSAENAVGEFVKTGKLDFRDLVTSMIADLAKLAARRFILGPIANALSSALGGAGGIFANILHAGGMVGSPGPGRMVPALAFAGAPRMHAGGWAGIRPDEVPAILQRGERVLSRREAAGYGQGSSSAPAVNVTIMARDAESFRQSRTQVASDIARAVSLGRRGM